MLAAQNFPPSNQHKKGTFQLINQPSHSDLQSTFVMTDRTVQLEHEEREAVLYEAVTRRFTAGGDENQPSAAAKNWRGVNR